MPLPSNKTLAKIAVYGAFASITAVMYMRIKIQERIHKSDYFREAFKILRSHKGKFHDNHFNNILFNYNKM